MAKRLILVFFIILLSTFGVYADGVRNWTDVSDFSAERPIDEYTATYIRPWLVNWHITEPHQAKNDYRGGETGQRCTAGAVCTANPEVVLIGGDTWGISRSDDGGNTWHPSSVGAAPYGISDIEFYPGSANIAFAMVTNVREPIRQTTGIYKSENAGRTWRQVLTSFSNY